MRRLTLPVLLLLLSAHATAQVSVPTLEEQQQAVAAKAQAVQGSQTAANIPTLEAQQQAVAAQVQALQSMQGMSLEQQQAFAKAWAEKHRTAFAATAVKNGDGVNQAYAFRNNMGGDAQCQRYAEQADNVYLSSTLEQDAKQEQLARIGAQAKTANCTQ